MANNGSSSNSSGAFRATLQFAPATDQDQVPDNVREELARAAVIEVDLSGLEFGGVVYSVTAPSDKTKLWQKIDGATGIPVGQTQKYDSATGQWGNLVGSDTILELSDTDDNLITLDVNGRIRVRKPRVDVLTFTTSSNGQSSQSFADAFSYDSETAYRIVGLVPQNAAGAAAEVYVVDQVATGVTLGFASVSGSATVQAICEESWEHVLED